MVELHRTTYTAHGTVVEFAIGVHAATRFAWTYDFKVPDSAKAEEESKRSQHRHGPTLNGHGTSSRWGTTCAHALSRSDSAVMTSESRTQPPISTWGMMPLIIFTGATSRTTRDRMPRGEAEHYRERAMELGVPGDAILVEPRARNTGENIRFSRALLEERRVAVSCVLLVSKPYEERRAYATARKLWPEVEWVSTSNPMPGRLHRLDRRCTPRS